MQLKIFQTEIGTNLPLPLFSSSVKAGFPSPVEDHIEEKLDLNRLMIEHPAATFFLRVEGESMENANIHPGDILVVDRALTPQNGLIIVAVLNGEFTVKRLKKKGNRLYLLPENRTFPEIEITAETEFQIWGVVTFIIHKAR